MTRPGEVALEPDMGQYVLICKLPNGEKDWGLHESVDQARLEAELRELPHYTIAKIVEEK